MKIRISAMALAAGIFLMSPIQSSYGESIYGWELMTEQERVEHRLKMQSLKTAEEREKYRQEHHKEMQERAKEKGIALSDTPPRGGSGMGPGMGRGMQGMGPGGRGMQGMGPRGPGMGQRGRGGYGPAYAWNLMTEDEKAEYRNKMQSLKTPEERDKYRLEQYKKMQARAKEKGITLPDMPPRSGRGMARGPEGQEMGPEGQDYRPGYAWSLMTEQEKAEYRKKMQSLQEERDKYRLEQYKKMQARAKEKGITLPDMPLRGARGMGRGPGGRGMGPGMMGREGRGMGPGGRGYGPGYAWSLMSEQEKAEFRDKMQSLKTPEEQEKYQLDQYKKMQARAKEKGVTLPDMPPRGARGMGRGPGGRGMGPSMGPGMMGQEGRGMGPGMMGQEGQGMGPGMMGQEGRGMGPGMMGQKGRGMGPGGRGYGPGYAWSLMSEQEKAEFRDKMQSLKTPEEQEKYQLEQYKKMQARAKEQGVELPDMPPQHGRGMGPGPGGRGMGPRGMGYGPGAGAGSNR